MQIVSNEAFAWYEPGIYCERQDHPIYGIRQVGTMEVMTKPSALVKLARWKGTFLSGVRKIRKGYEERKSVLFQPSSLVKM